MHKGSSTLEDDSVGKRDCARVTGGLNACRGGDGIVTNERTKRECSLAADVIEGPEAHSGWVCESKSSEATESSARIVEWSCQ